MRYKSIVPLVVLLAAQIGAVGAELPTTPSSRDGQQILDYQLTMPRSLALISALESMTKYVTSLPDFMERIKKSMSMTPAARAAQMESDPKAMAILKQNGLTAQEYVVGVPTLRMALMAAQGAHVAASPANVAFAKAHLAELKPKMDAADGLVHPS